MKKNYFFSKLILCGLFTLATATTFVGCKDYDDDIDNLQSQITANGEAIKKLQELVGAGKFVTAVEATDKGIKVTLNDNTSTEIELAKKGEDAVAPQLQVKDGVWQISLDNGKTFTDMKDATTGEVIKMPEAGEAGTKVEITPEGQIKIGDKVTDFMKTADFVVIDNENRSLVFKIGDQTVYVPMAATTVQSIVFVPRYTDGIARAYSLVAYIDANGDIQPNGNPKDKKELVAPRLPFDYEINPATVDLTKAVWAFNTTKAKVATRAAGTSVIDVDASTKPVIDGNKVTIWGVVNDKYEEPEGNWIEKDLNVEVWNPITNQWDNKLVRRYEFVPEEAYMASALMTYKLNDEANAQEIASDYTEFRISEQNAYGIGLFRSDRDVSDNNFGLVDGIDNFDPSETVGNLDNDIFRFKYDDAAGLDLTTLYGGYYNGYNVSPDKLEDLGLGKISVSVEFATEKTLKNYLEKKLNTTPVAVAPALKALLANSKYYNLNAAKTGISVKSEYGIAAVGNNNGALLLVTYKVGDLVIGTKVIKAVASKEAGVEGQSYTYPNPIKFVISQTSNVDANGNFVAGQETSLVEVYKTAGYTPEEFATKLKGIVVKTVDEDGDEIFNARIDNSGNFTTTWSPMDAPTFNLDATKNTAFTSKTPLTIHVGSQTPVGTYTLTADITLENSVVFTITATVVVDYPFTFDAATLEAFHAESWWKANNTDMQVRGIYGDPANLNNPGTFALEGDMENAYKEQFTLNGKTFVVANFGQLVFEEIPVAKYEDNAYFDFTAIPTVAAQKAGNPLAYNLGKAASVKVSFRFVNGETLAVETPNVYMVNPVKNPTMAAAELQQGNPNKSKIVLSDLTQLLDQNGNKVYAPKTASAAAGLVNNLAQAAVYGVTGPTYELTAANNASVDAFEVLEFADANRNSVIIKQGLTLQKERTVKVKVTFQTIWGPVSSLVDVKVKPQD